MRKSCDAHGAQEVLISCSAEWFDDAMSFAPVLVAPLCVRHGCISTHREKGGSDHGFALGKERSVKVSKNTTASE